MDNYERPNEAWPEVDRLLGRTQALNPDLVDLHAGLGVRAFFFGWDWATAEREWQTAFSAPDGQFEPALLMTFALERWATGHVADSLRLVRRARALDPISAYLILAEAQYLYQTAEYASAASLYGQLINDHPPDSRTYFGLAAVRAAEQRFDDAIIARRQGHELEGDDRDDEFKNVLMNARGDAGYRLIEREAVRLVELPTLHRRLARGRYASPLDFARAHAQLGNTNDAFRFLDAAFTDRAPGLVFLNVDRAWNAVRDDPRFAAAVRKVKL